jgi:hypothetical protein
MHQPQAWLSRASQDVNVSEQGMRGGTYKLVAQIVKHSLKAGLKAQDVAVLGGVGVLRTMECAFH